MLHITDEGEDLRTGINVYPLNSKFHLGFRIRFHTANSFRVYGFRWSKVRKRFHFWKTIVDKRLENTYS